MRWACLAKIEKEKQAYIDLARTWTRAALQSKHIFGDADDPRRSESREAASVGGLAIKAPIAAVADPRDVASSLRISRPAEHAPPGRVDLAAPDLQLHMTGPTDPVAGRGRRGFSCPGTPVPLGAFPLRSPV
jgi:hypothetical protein